MANRAISTPGAAVAQAINDITAEGVCPRYRDQVELFVERLIGTFDRERLDAMIEYAIARLDQLDGDPDLEAIDEREIDEDAEPSLGASYFSSLEVDLEIDDCDREPTLGWSEFNSLHSDCEP